MEIKRSAVAEKSAAPVQGSALPSIQEVAAQVASEASGADSKATAEAVVASASEAAPAAAQESVESAPVVEVAPAEKPAAKDHASARFAALSKKEKAIREAEQRAKTEAAAIEARLKAREAEIDARAKAAQEREDRASAAQRPLDLLKAKGWTYQDATEDVLGNYKPKEPDPLDARLSPVQAQLEKLAKENEELRKLVEGETTTRKQREAEQQYREFVDAVKRTISTGVDKYELTSALGDDAVDIVRETMLECYRKNGETPGYDEACEMVEEFLEKRYVEPFEKTKKLQARFNKPAATTPQAAKPKEPRGVTAPKTLTNATGAASSATDDIDKMTRAEAIAYLAKKYG